MSIKVTVTAYHPINTKLEGGVLDRYGRPLVTLEQANSFPETDLDSEVYYSIAADFKQAWYKKDRLVKVILDDGTKIPGIGKLCDTGQHFYGSGKVIRNPGHEPIDICTNVKSKLYSGVHTGTMYFLDQNEL